MILPKLTAFSDKEVRTDWTDSVLQQRNFKVFERDTIRELGSTLLTQESKLAASSICV